MFTTACPETIRGVSPIPERAGPDAAHATCHGDGLYAHASTLCRRFLLVMLPLVFGQSCAHRDEQARIAAPQVQSPEPGYHCEITDDGAFGLISSQFDIPDSGGLRGGIGLLWFAARDCIHWNTNISADWFKPTKEKFSIDHGYVAITRSHVNEKLTLALTTYLHPESSWPLFEGNFPNYIGPLLFEGSWADVSAFARGASHLYAVTLNIKHQIVDQIEIDRTIFDRAAPRILAAFEKADKLLADPAHGCEHTDDLHALDVVVNGSTRP
jgi:hypothetical protein